MFIIEGMDKCSSLELLNLPQNLPLIADGEGIPFIYSKGKKKSAVLFSDNAVHSHAFSPFKAFYRKFGFCAIFANLRFAPHCHITMAHKMGKRHFNMVAQPQDKRTRRVIAQNQSASRFQDFLYAVKKVLRVRIVMKAVGTDDRVETVLRKRKIFAITNDKFRVGDILFLGLFNHFRR